MDYYEEGIGPGCENLKEAEIIVQIVQALTEQLDPEEVGVITPFKNQKKRIIKLLNNPNVEVDTVYRFQGREKDVIILSFCKSKVGRLTRFIREFIGNPSQVNVALTRARKKLIIVGNSKTLKQSRLIASVFERIGNGNRVVYEEFLAKDSN